MESLVKESWSGKKVLVTGHTGFKGAWLCCILKKMNAVVCGISLEPKTPKDIFLKAGVETLIDSHNIADIRDRSKIEKVFSQFKPEVVIHMAAQPLVRYSYENPFETYEVNVIGTLNILDMCRKFHNNLKAILVITTDKCYDNKEQIWSYRESDPMGGHDPYSSSKGCCELLVQSYRKSFFSFPGMPLLASARAGNVIGGGDWAEDRLIPDVVKAKIADRKVSLRSPEAQRPWQHVLEPLCGYLMLCQHLINSEVEYAGGWNFGPNETDFSSVGDIVSLLNEKWDSNADFIELVSNSRHEANLLMLDSTKAKHFLRWSPRWSIEICLENVVDWYKSVEGGGDALKITNAQIEEYFAGKL